MRRKIVLGNWKLNGSQAFASTLLQRLAAGWVGAHQAEVVVCPPFVYLTQGYTELIHSNITLGGQDVSAYEEGAYTGDISGEMLHDAGCQYTLVGHSERRRYNRESNALTAKKFVAAQKAHLAPVLCVGETEQDRESGNTFKVIADQLDVVTQLCGAGAWNRAVIGYEPVWAIGTGKVASPEQAQEVHKFIRARIGEVGEQTRIVYGGSVSPTSASALFSQPDIDGALVGGASLKAKDFLQICQAAE